MPRHTICAYADQAEHGAGPALISDGTQGLLTGHHMIPDHCFYYTGGLRGKGDLSYFLCPDVVGYTTGSAPVIIVEADKTGGKSHEHGRIHSLFDVNESIAARANSNANEWTYANARAVAVSSVRNCITLYSEAELIDILDSYYKGECGIIDGTLLRAGEHGSMKTKPTARKSKRTAAKVKKYVPRFSPF